MNLEINTRSIRQGEEDQVCAIATRSFDSYIGHEYSAEGVAEFHKYADPVAMANRVASGDHFVLVAEYRRNVVGMIEFRENEHLSMLFVDPAFFRQGVSRALFEHALTMIRRVNLGLERITVNSSRYAVPVYKSFGFVTAGPERTVNGITFIPMALKL